MNDDAFDASFVLVTTTLLIYSQSPYNRFNFKK
jgi:hypothetical protein